MLLVLLSFLWWCFVVVQAQYEVPEAKVEVYTPRGFRVSIPDHDGIRLFAFHGKINEELNGREAGTFSKDILKPKDGRWTFYEPYAKLKVGDKIHYWTYVEHLGLGYPNDDQLFVVKELLEKPYGSSTTSEVTVPPPVTQQSTSAPPTDTGDDGCQSTPTKYNNGKSSCKGKQIFSDSFTSQVREKYWTVSEQFAGPPVRSGSEGRSSQCPTPSVTTVSGTHAPEGRICPGDLIFEDNFDNFNLQKWQHELTLGGGGNWEFQWYNNNRTNSYVENGTLHIKPTLLADEKGADFLYSGTLDVNGGSPAEQCTNPLWYGCVRTGNKVHILNPVKSARIRTVNSFAFKYGKSEIRAKIPSGDWLWPAIWMMPRWNAYSTWPASGEIDIMESRGNKDLISSYGVNIGSQQVGSTLHWGPNLDYNKFMLTHYEQNNKSGYDTDFHRYQVEWTPERIVFSVDDVVTGKVSPPDGGFWELGNLTATGLESPWKGNSKMAPFDQEFYIILNLAVGGVTYFPDDATNPGGKPWLNTSPKALTDFWEGRAQWLPTWNVTADNTHFLIDYVRVWAL